MRWKRAYRLVVMKKISEIEDVQELKKNHVHLINYTSHSTDLSPADFFLFPKLKLILKEERWKYVQVIKQKSATILNYISSEEWRQCFIE